LGTESQKLDSSVGYSFCKKGRGKRANGETPVKGESRKGSSRKGKKLNNNRESKKSGLSPRRYLQGVIQKRKAGKEKNVTQEKKEGNHVEKKVKKRTRSKKKGRWSLEA